MDEQLKYTGIVSGISGWVFILSSISINPWFVFTEHAFSDLGGKMASNPGLFNSGMMFTGLLVLAYGVYLMSVNSNRAQKAGSFFTGLSGLALFLIGLFPTGTDPHYFVSIWFFLQTDLAIGAWGLGLVKGKNRVIGALLSALSVIGPIGAILVNWPSTATVEAYGIVIMNIWVVLMTKLSLSED